MLENSLLWLSVILIGIRAARSHKADGSGQLCGRQTRRESLRGEGVSEGRTWRPSGGADVWGQVAARAEDPLALRPACILNSPAE